MVLTGFIGSGDETSISLMLKIWIVWFLRHIKWPVYGTYLETIPDDCNTGSVMVT